MSAVNASAAFVKGDGGITSEWVWTANALPSRFVYANASAQGETPDARADTTFRVVRRLNRPPVANYGGPYLSIEATSAAGASVTLDGTGSSDPDNDLIVFSWSVGGVALDDRTSARPTGVFPIGATFGVLAVSDGALITSQVFAVTVVDTTAPWLTVPADINILTGGATTGVHVNFGPTAQDVVDGSVPVSCSPASGSIFPAGTTVVACVAADSHGNVRVGTFRVTVTVPTGMPRLSQRVLGTSPRSAGQITVSLQISNLGDGAARYVELYQVVFRTLAGSGSVSLATPLPIVIGEVAAGSSALVMVTLNVPAAVTRFSITETGRYVDPRGATYSISMGVPVTP
jgi:hypothetical protein